MSKDNKDGWKYISAILDMVTENSNDIFEPHYVYRGITKRYFSESKKIIDHLKEKNEIAENTSQKEIKNKVVGFYKNVIYLSMMLNWILLENTDIKDINALKKYINENKYLADYSPSDEVLNSAINKLSGLERNENKNVLSILESIDKEKYKLFIPEYIESGLAVRLQEFQDNNENKSNKHIDYINYIDNMIKELKTRFPKYVDEDYTDLEILADIQHKGAASCLVDFSSNLLTSLWFATNSDYKDFGFLFCYDINNDVLVKDKLTILDTQRHDEKSINKLLYETTKATTYSGKREYKFWLWRPSNLNERIARQDSVFVFGLEKFIVDDHSLKVIPIPPNWKKPIQHALKTYFGISGESIYCDIDGYADSNSKTSPYEKTVFTYFRTKQENQNEINNIEYLQNGMSCLFDCEYESALQYFILYEQNIKEINLEGFTSKDNNDEELKIYIELHYSKAICLKNLKKLNGAIVEYNKIVEDGKKVLDNLKGTGNYDYIRNKYLKSINDLIDIYYDTKQYDKITAQLDKISEILNEDGKDLYKRKDEAKEEKELKEIEEAIAKFCDLKNNYLILELTTKNEVVCLKALEAFAKKEYNKGEDNNNIESDQSKKGKALDFLDQINISDPTENDSLSNQPLYYALNLYFKEIVCVLYDIDIDKEDEVNFEDVISNKEATVKKVNELNDLNKFFYPQWNLKDIENSIAVLNDSNKKFKLNELTSKMEDYVDFCIGLSGIDPY